MKRILADGWFQMFTAVAGLSVLIWAFDRRAPAPLLPEPPTAAVYSMPLSSVRSSPAAAPVSAPASMPVSAPAAAPVSAPVLPPSAARTAASRAEAASRLSPENYVRAGSGNAPRSVAGESPSPMGAAPSAAASGSFPIFRIAPKTTGRWIVSNQEGPDVDSPSIARVIFSAADGDLILIRPGMYLEPLMVLHKTLTFRGLGAKPEEVLITSPSPTAVLEIFHGTVNLVNLRIEPEKGFSATAAAVYVVSGRVALRDVVARSQGAAIQAAQGQGSDTVVEAASSRLDGAYADVLVRGKARVAMKNVDFTNARQPLVLWRDTELRLDSCRFPKDAKARIYAYEESSVSVNGTPSAPPVFTKRADPDAAADKAKFASDQKSGQPARAGWMKDIFRPGRKPGDLN